MQKKLLGFFTLFMNFSDDRHHKGSLGFMPLPPKIRLTNKGLYNATLHAYLNALEIEEYKESTNERIAQYSDSMKYHDTKLEEKILKGCFDPEIYLRAFQGLLKVDRGKFVNGWERKEKLKEKYNINKERFQQQVKMGFMQTKSQGQYARPTPYFNNPIEIRNKETCSAPYMVLMYNLIALSLLKKPEIIGEGGTGCAYHVANTAVIFPDSEIYTWEDQRKRCLLKDDLNLSKRIHKITRNCFAQNTLKGLPDHFDEFYFTFNIPKEEMLQPFINNLNKGGILIAPVSGESQGRASTLRVYLKEDTIRKTDLCCVSFREAIMPESANQK